MKFDRVSLQAPGCDELKPVCNVFEEMNKMEEIKSHQEHYGMKRPPPKKRAENKETFKRQKVVKVVIVIYNLCIGCEFQLNWPLSFGGRDILNKNFPQLNSHFSLQPKTGGDGSKQQNPAPTLVNFQLLKQKYVGHNNEGELIQTFNPAGTGTKRTCVLIVQGHVFKGKSRGLPSKSGISDGPGLEVDLRMTGISKFWLFENAVPECYTIH